MINEFMKLLVRFVESMESIADSTRDIASYVEDISSSYCEKSREVTELIREIEEGSTAFNVYNCKRPHAKTAGKCYDSVSNLEGEEGTE